MGFNLGVEAGQLMVVAVWCGVFLLFARLSGYRTVMVKAGSVALIVLSLSWTVQRVAFSMAVPDSGLVIGMTPLLVGSARVRMRKACAQECGDEQSCFHIVSKLAGM